MEYKIKTLKTELGNIRLYEEYGEVYYCANDILDIWECLADAPDLLREIDQKEILLCNVSQESDRMIFLAFVTPDGAADLFNQWTTLFSASIKENIKRFYKFHKVTSKMLKYSVLNQKMKDMELD